MKRIVICSAQVPFERGGAEALVNGLRLRLADLGHAVEVITLPFKWYPAARLLSSCLAWRMLDLSEANGRPIDLLIATKFPSYAVRHANKVTWLVHQFRQAYDWYGTPLGGFSPSAEDTRVRQAIFAIDRRTLGESKRLFAISRNVASRLQRYNGLTAEPLYPPTLLEGRLRCDSYGDSIAYIGRLDAAKRVDLLVKAMRFTPASVHCLIAGAGPERERLEHLARAEGVSGRISFLGWVDDEALIRLYAECFAVFYAPLDEDYGYATVEAFQAGKPVVTAEDSGGVLEFVRDGVSGLVASPQPHALAEQISRLYASKDLCSRLGAAGHDIVSGIRWQPTIERLLAE